MENSLQGTVDGRRRKRRPAVWGKRLAGLAIVLSGGTLLANDLVRMVNTGSVPASTISTTVSQ